MGAGQWTLLTLVRLSLLLLVTADVNVMKDVTLGFGQALELCREESQLSVDQMDQFFEFWREEFRFERRELGCALLCMSRHYNLLTDASRMHHENTHRFIQSFPNGEVLAQKMVSVIHSCEQQFNEEHDHCWRVLRVAECFKNTCQREGLAPSVELMMAELIMEAE